VKSGTRGSRRRQTEAPLDAVSEPGLLDPVTVSRLETLPVRARVIVEGALSGLHRARLHGSSVEFAEHKEYSPGDEIRHIDWKVYGRADRFYVKQFEQESELSCYLALDASGSMEYGGDGLTKLRYAAHLLAALAYLLIRQRDKVGLLVFGDEGLDRYVPPRARPAHLHDLLAVLDEVTRAGGRGSEPTYVALDRLGELTRKRRSLVIVASDLFEPEARSLGILRRLRARGHDVALFQILHPHELELPFEGLTLFESLEDKRQLMADPAAIRRQYKRRMAEFLDRVRSECVRGGVEYHLVATSRPLEQALLDFLTQRGGRGPVRASGGGTRAGSGAGG
jgi:uncharacterized protein (DUF58 family)